MRSADQAQLMLPIKLSDYILAENEAHSSIVVCPSLDVELRVRPEKITEKSCVWHILGSGLLVDALEVVEVGAQAAVHAKDAVVDDGCHREDVETGAELAPDAHVISPLALVIEAIHPIDRLAFMISSQQIEILWELYLVRQEQCYGLDTLLSTVNVVADEQEFLLVLWVPGDVEQSEQIEVLAMYVSEHFDWRLEVKEHLLILEHLRAFVDQELDCFLIQLDWFAPLAVLDFNKLINDAVGDKLPFVIRLRLRKILAVLESLGHFVHLLLG